MALSTVAILVAGAVIYFFSLDEFDRTAFVDQSGYIDNGGKFSIHIGDSEQKVLRTISNYRRKITFDGMERGGSCLKHDMSGGNLFRIYDLSLGGTICVSTRNQRVVAIAWNFNSLIL